MASWTAYRLGIREVWDITVEGDHSYTSGGIAHHNSGIQPHNLIRHKAKDVEAERAAARTVADYGEMLRSTILAPAGRALVWSDWSAIEARVAPWLSIGPDAPAEENESAEKLLQLFTRGEDVYLHEASGIFGREIKKGDPERQIGKVTILSCGFGGGAGALNSMVRNYGMAPLDDPKAIVDAWRAINPWAVGFCRRVERAAMAAVGSPGTAHRAGRLTLVASGGTLVMLLPDGSWLAYPKARIDWVDRFESGEEQRTVTFNHPVYGRSAFSGPVCAENPTQAVAARLLTGAMVAADRAGLDLVMTTHDEIVVECDAGEEPMIAAALDTTMTAAPEWASGLPLDAESGWGAHYQVDVSHE